MTTVTCIHVQVSPRPEPFRFTSERDRQLGYVMARLSVLEGLDVGSKSFTICCNRSHPSPKKKNS